MLLNLFIALLLIFYLIPVLVIGVYNFIRFVIFGDMTYSEFINNAKAFSHLPVKHFYDGLYDKWEALMHRLKH